MATNRFIGQSYDNTPLEGTYDFRGADVWIPTETTLSVAPTASGEIRYVSNSGVLTIWDGAEWQLFQLSGLVPDTGIAPNDPSVSGVVSAWYRSVSADITIVGNSGVDLWDDIALQGAVRHDMDNTIGGASLGQYVGNSGVYFDGNDGLRSSTLDSEIGGTDQPVVVIAAIRNTEDITGANCIFMSWNDSSSTPGIAFYVTTASGTRSYQTFKRDGSSTQASVIATAGGGLNPTSEIVTWYHDGTSVSMYASGQAVTSSAEGMDVGSMTLGYSTLGVLSRPGFGNSNFFTGFIHEIVVCNSGITSEQRKGIEKFLSYQWEIPLLPQDDNQ